MNWYKQSTSQFDILTRKVSTFYLNKIKELILKKDNIEKLRSESTAKKIYNKKNYIIPYKEKYVKYHGNETFLSIDFQLLIGEEDHFNMGGLFIGLWGNEFKIRFSLNIPYYMLNLSDLNEIKEQLTVTIRHELEHLKEYREIGYGMEGTLEDGAEPNMEYFFEPAEIRATAISLKMIADKNRKKNDPPNYEATVDNYIYSYFSSFIDEQLIGTKAEQDLKNKYKQELLNYIRSN